MECSEGVLLYIDKRGSGSWKQKKVEVLLILESL